MLSGEQITCYRHIFVIYMMIFGRFILAQTEMLLCAVCVSGQWWVTLHLPLPVCSGHFVPLACVFQPPRNQNHIVAPVPFLTSLSTYSDVIPSTGCQSHSSCPRSSFPHLYNSLFQRGICGLFHLCRSNFLPIVHSYSQRRDSLWPPAHN